MSTIEYVKEDRIAIFRLNRPDKLNVLNVEAMKAFTEALIDFRDDDHLWVGIITGTGDKVFSAGVDVEDFLGMVEKTTEHKWRRPTAIMRDLRIFKPLIAACNGLTIGGGLEISLACDIMIAAENARFGLPEVRVGVCPGGGGTVRLPRTVPRRIAAEMLFTGKFIDAEEAYRIGLVNKVVPLDRLMEEAKKMAELICEASPLAVRYAKELMIRGMDLPLDEALRLEDDFQTLIMRTHDFKEGIKAFKEKRKPRWELK
ncbi:MAG: enoyl-CoA hydratase-related protein [Syntrophorhabdaceae bacterium]|nr:enoyl-CoA hydratase-related protein [Syntrophorhabdaceae bacterium]